MPHKERLQLAIHAITNKKISSIRKAAYMYGVSETTIRRRMKYIEKHDRRRKLTITEEATLVQWCITYDKRGAPIRLETLRQMAQILRSERIKDARISKNWVQSFLKRHRELATRLTRRFHYQRAQCEDPRIINEWFDRIRATIEEYGIEEDDVWNFDESGYALGLIGTAKVVTRRDRKGRPPLLQPGNREWVSTIETANARGLSLPPLIIFAAKTFRSTWFSQELPAGFAFTVSDNGWTTDQIGLWWLETIFEKYTKEHTKGQYRLLILDGHSSHLTPQFDQFCSAHSIIPLCMPSHSSHLLQPLDLSCFGPLKRAYGAQIEDYQRLGVNHIDKQDFLEAFSLARITAYKPTTIISGFRGTGLVPFDPTQVLKRLRIERTPPPPPSSPISHTSRSSTFQPTTPRTVRQLHRQIRVIEREAPYSPYVGQIIKGCELALHNTRLLAQENQDLRRMNQKQQQKKEQGKSATYFPYQGILNVQEGQQQAQQSEVSKRAPRCSICRSLEHNARTCAQRGQ
jgi:DDE superfamily endonuclease/Tc5 transposase DNA-binding domain/helix-turn-helix, Psq domain